MTTADAIPAAFPARAGAGPPPPSDADVARVAAAPSLLIVSDFDGTLAPLVADPGAAAPLPEAVAALRALCGLPGTTVAIVSGRDLASLSRALAGVPGLELHASHGAECTGEAPPATDGALLDRIAELLRPFVDATPGSFLERKPYGVAFHQRTADPAASARAVSGILSGPALLRGVYVRTGSMVLELSTSEATKAGAAAAIRALRRPDAMVALGDDDNDEEVFAAMGATDLPVKIGPGRTVARSRLPDPEAAAALLTRIAVARAAHLGVAIVPWSAPAAAPAAPAPRDAVPYPIERLSLLSDQRTVALVTADAGIVWLCLPRIDSPAALAALVDGPVLGERAGAFSISPVDGAAAVEQSYDGDSFILRTRFPTATVTDYFDCSAGRPYQRAGRTDLVRFIEGTGRVRVRFAPRLDFGRTHTRLSLLDGGLEVTGGADPMVLFSPGVQWVIADDAPHQTASAEIDLAGAGASLVIELRCGTRNLRPSPVPEQQRREQTRRFWQSWAGTLAIPAGTPHAALVRRSALVLKALCYGPTGAFAAAGTTSLPETLGGVRNWDYRYCWPRDAAYSASALVRLGCTGPGVKFLDWVISVIEDLSSPDRLRPVYTVTGHDLGPEAEISNLAGYGGSRPVRVGNAASGQVQLDVFGPIVELVALLAERGAPVTPEYWRVVEHMVAAVGARWREPDHGIWEFRKPPSHHVHSKVMCWATLDRALAVADQYLGRGRDDWKALQGAIAADVLEHGFDPDLGAFTLSYGARDLDAATLRAGLCGLLPPDDPRFVGTVRAVERGLRQGPTVYRYRCDDGLPGVEGGFHICATWLAESLCLIGRKDEAGALLDAIAALAGPTGLLPEQFDPLTGRSLGNHPQAYSHLGFINAAVRLGAR